MADDTKPTVEEIRARLAEATPGPWRVCRFEQHESWGRVGNAEAIAAERHVVYGDSEDGSIWLSPGDAALISNAPTDIAFLLERDAAGEKRLAEVEAELAAMKAAPELTVMEQHVRDIAEMLHHEGLDTAEAQDWSAGDIVRPANLLAKVLIENTGKWRERVNKLNDQLAHAEERIADLNEHLAQYAGEPPHAQLVAELGGIRERARAEVGSLRRYQEPLKDLMGYTFVSEEHQRVENEVARIGRILGIESGEGGGDAG